MTLADRGYPKKLAYQYLDELQKEFTSLYASEIEKELLAVAEGMYSLRNAGWSYYGPIRPANSDIKTR